MTDELAFKGYYHKPRLSHRDATAASRLVGSAPGGLPWTPRPRERAGVCDAGVTFSKGAGNGSDAAQQPPHRRHCPK